LQEISSKLNQIQNKYKTIDKNLNVYHEIQFTLKKIDKNELFSKLSILKNHN
jgi:hypothetical protein